jgi:hypothetical protein
VVVAEIGLMGWLVSAFEAAPLRLVVLAIVTVALLGWASFCFIARSNAA